MNNKDLTKEQILGLIISRINHEENPTIKLITIDELNYNEKFKEIMGGNIQIQVILSNNAGMGYTMKNKEDAEWIKYQIIDLKAPYLANN